MESHQRGSPLTLFLCTLAHNFKEHRDLGGFTGVCSQLSTRPSRSVGILWRKKAWDQENKRSHVFHHKRPNYVQKFRLIKSPVTSKFHVDLKMVQNPIFAWCTPLICIHMPIINPRPRISLQTTPDSQKPKADNGQRCVHCAKTDENVA